MTQAKPSPGQTDKPVDIQSAEQSSHEKDPRAELGLKSPTKDSDKDESTKRQEAEGQKATQFDGNPSAQGAPSSPLGPKDDTPTILGKESRNDQ